MLLYIRLNRDRVTDRECLEPFLPVRKKSGGREPYMKNEQIRGPHHQCEVDEEKLLWIYRSAPQSSYLRRKILGKVVEIGIRVPSPPSPTHLVANCSNSYLEPELVPGSAVQQQIF